jgi:hypothetical protein
MNLGRQSDQYDTRRVLVEARHDARLDARAAIPSVSRAAQMPQQGVEERSRPVAVRRVDNHPWRLVDRHQGVVLVEDADVDRLGLRRWAARPRLKPRNVF